jgi:hypothetical protein
MNFPQFGRVPLFQPVEGGVANLAKDGTTGTYYKFVEMPWKPVPVTIDTATDKVSVANWGFVSVSNQIVILPGDKIVFLSGTPATGTALNTEYIITDFSVTGDTASFKLLNSSNVVIDLTGSPASLIAGFNIGGRIDVIEAKSAQPTARAASSAMTICIFHKKPTSAALMLVGEFQLPTATASVSVIGATATNTPTGGFLLNSGESLWFTQSAYAGVQDRVVVHARGSIF